MEKKKAYIVTLTWETWQKRFRFEGDNTEEAEKKFEELCKSLNPFAEVAKDSKDFFENSIAFFAENGFVRIPH